MNVDSVLPDYFNNGNKKYQNNLNKYYSEFIKNPPTPGTRYDFVNKGTVSLISIDPPIFYMPSPLAPDPIKVQPCVCCLF